MSVDDCASNGFVRPVNLSLICRDLHESWKLSAGLETADGYICCIRLLEAPAQKATESGHDHCSIVLSALHCATNAVPPKTRNADLSRK